MGIYQNNWIAHDGEDSYADHYRSQEDGAEGAASPWPLCRSLHVVLRFVSKHPTDLSFSRHGNGLALHHARAS
jgi:hypothetical protein